MSEAPIPQVEQTAELTPDLQITPESWDAIAGYVQGSDHMNPALLAGAAQDINIRNKFPDIPELSEEEAGVVFEELQRRNMVAKEFTKGWGYLTIKPELSASAEAPKGKVHKFVGKIAAEAATQSKENADLWKDKVRTVTRTNARQAKKEAHEKKEADAAKAAAREQAWQAENTRTLGISPEAPSRKPDTNSPEEVSVKETVLPADKLAELHTKITGVKRQLRELSSTYSSKQELLAEERAAMIAVFKDVLGEDATSQDIQNARRQLLTYEPPRREAKRPGDKPADMPKEQPPKPEAKEASAEMLELDQRIGAEIADYLRVNGDNTPKEVQTEQKRLIRESVIREHLGPTATDEQVLAVMLKLRSVR